MYHGRVGRRGVIVYAAFDDIANKLVVIPFGPSTKLWTTSSPKLECVRAASVVATYSARLSAFEPCARLWRRLADFRLHRRPENTYGDALSRDVHGLSVRNRAMQ